MLKNQIHYETKVEEEAFTFICRAGCPTIKAYQAADEYRTYLFGVLKQQEEAAKAAAEQSAAQPEGLDGNKQ